MKCVLTRDEAQHMLRTFAHPHFTNCRNFGVVVEVDYEWAKSILPPGLELEAPVVNFMLSKGDQFSGLVSGLQVRHGDLVGLYGLTYMMDTDLAVIYGREGLAEPKKLADTKVEVVDNKVVGTVTRFGQELFRLEAEIAGPGPADLAAGPADFFHYKYSIKADGSGLEPVHLINSHFENLTSDPVIMNVTKLELNASPFDIFGDIPVKQVLSSFAVTIDMVGSAYYLEDIDPDAFLPFAFMKHDDYRLTMQID